MMQPSDNRILVAFDSPLGSTAEVARFIGDILVKDGVSVDVKSVSQVDNLAAYDGVIIGGAIRYDKWSSGVVSFTKLHHRTLQRMPVAFFLTCLTLAKPSPTAERKANSYADQICNLYPNVRPNSVGKFAGVLNFSLAPWYIRQLLRVLSIVTKVKEGDYRDWEAIRIWSLGLSFLK